MKKQLIILHGALGSKKQFTLLKELLDSDYNVYLMDFNGHGGTQPADQFGIDLFTKELAEFIDHNKLSTPYVFGYSMGGYVALNLELKRPGTLAGIFTLATKFNWTPVSAVKEAAYLDPVKIREKVPKYASFLQSLHGDEWESTLRSTAKMMLELGQDPILNKTVLGSIAIPSCLAVGSEDKMVSIEETKRFAGYIPKSELMIWEGVEHPFERIEPEFIADKIRSFII